MLIEGCGLGGGLVEECIIGDGGIDGGRERCDQGLFAACDVGHGVVEGSGEPRTRRREEVETGESRVA